MKLSELMDAPNELSVRIIGQKDQDNNFPLLQTFVSMMDMFLELVENPEYKDFREKAVDWVDVRKTEVVIKVY